MSRTTVKKFLVLMGAAAVFFWFGHGARAATITVNTTADEYGTGAGCSLREAIQAANTDSASGGCPAGSGADIINLPAGTYQLSIANTGGVNEDSNATGDLDINSSMTIQGAGASTTFIQAGTSTSNGIDKVFGVNPTCAGGVNVTIDGVTIRYGRNTQPYGAPDYSYTGGGLDWCGGTGTESFTLSNSVVSDNTNVNGYGGGLNIDSINNYTGDITITNVTFQNNQSQINQAGNTWGGGAIHIKGHRPDVIITNSTFTNNSIMDPDSAGGAVYYGPIYGGSLTVHGSTFTNNTASWGGGIGIYHLVSPAVGSPTVTIDQNTQIANNTATSGGGGIYIGGSYLNGTFLLSDLRVLQNTAPEGGGIYVGLANATIRYSRIVDNHVTAGTGTGLYKDNHAATVTATNNWWGCSTGPSSAPCDTAVIAADSSGSLTGSPYLQLRTSATPSTVALGGNATVAASFGLNSAGTDVSANINRLIGLPVTWSAVGGSLSGQQTTIQANGTATATYQASAVGSGQVAAVVDNDTTAPSRANVASITVNKIATTTSVTSSANPATPGQSVIFTATVSPTPTGGTAAFRDNGSVIAGCGTQTLTAGQATCSTSDLALGSHTITAEYGGNADYLPSSGTLSPDQQITCPSAITVANNADSGAGSLRQAITDVCNGGTIDFAAGLANQTIGLTSAELTIGKTITIANTGAPNLAVSGNNARRVFYIQASGNLTASGLRIVNGYVDVSNQGAGIRIASGGRLTLLSCTLSGHSIITYGGAIYNESGGTLTLVNSTVTGNSAGYGSFVFNWGTLTIKNSTIAGNTDSYEGCILNRGTLNMYNTIMGNNSNGDCVLTAAVMGANGNNLMESTGGYYTCGLTDGVNGNIIGKDPVLGTLGSYGGSSYTLPLLPGSPAIDGGDDATCAAAPANSLDQRGIARPQGTHCDMGAFESRGFTLTKTGGDNQSAAIYSSFADPLTLTVTSEAGEPVNGGVVTFTAPSSGPSTNPPTNNAGITAGAASRSVTADGTVGGPYTVVASAGGAAGVTYSLNNTPSADLAITVTDGMSIATPGGSVTYTITTSNAGPSNAPGATVADTFAASLTCTWSCVGAGGGTCTASGSGNINDTVDLPAGGSVTYTASCTISPSATGSMSNTATVTAPGGVTDFVPTNNTATDSDTLAANADLAITVTDGMTIATSGGSVTYTITTSNAGPSNAPGATVADTFAASLTCTWTCVGAGGGTCTASGSGNINETVNLPAGGSVTYTASCTISPSATGTLSNTATVAAPGGVTDPTPGNNSGIDTTALCSSAVTVINNADNGVGSLRQAIADVCAGGTIGFAPDLSGQTITLTGEQLAIGKSVTIDGPTTSPGVSVSGNNAVRVFSVSAGTVTINNLTIRNGNSVPAIPGNIGGAGLFVTNSGTAVTLNNCAVLDNHAANPAYVTGGGIVVNTNAGLTMNNCTVSGNSATFDGGGILNLGTLSINNGTIVGNSTPGYGGGLETVAGTVTLRNTILAGNSGPSAADCYTPAGSIQSAGYNLIGSTSNCTVSPGTGDVTGLGYNFLLLGTLQNNGGPTSTYALLPGSPAIDAGPGCNGAPATDQRGLARTGSCDIGAFESQGFTFAKTGGDNQSTLISTSFATPLALTVTANNAGEPVNGGIVTFTPPASGAGITVTTPFTHTIAGGGVSVNATANGTAGSYNVVAGAAGATGVSFSLTNVGHTLLSIIFAGNGGNKVESTSPDQSINCSKGSSSGCSAGYAPGTAVTLKATPDWKSVFMGWSGDFISTDNPGTVTMTADKTVTATFDPDNKAKLIPGDTLFASIQDAYAGVSSGSLTIQAQVWSFLEDLLFNNGTSVTLTGGMDASYNPTTGYSTVKSMTVGSGSAVIRNIIIK